ncbi:MAG: mechanosensitive ion channel [Bacteroidales bacterium]|nr:mechanosensitive ion channel [Bacteroidales bacterium]
MEEYLDKVIELLVLYGPKLIGAIFVLIIGLIVIKLIKKGVAKIFAKKEFDQSLQSFLKSMIGIVLQALLWISVLGMVGIQMTSFIAILGAAGLAIGMALTGTLQNFAGGVMILLFKPFKVGDVIEAQGVVGAVKQIQIFNTILNTPDNKTIIIPNAQLSNTLMTNYSTEPQRRVDWTFGIGYGDNVDKAQEVLNNLISQDQRILKNPEHFIAVSALADSSVNLVVRAWVSGADYWGVFFDMNKKVYEEFSKAGLNIPFPQMDVHVHNK